MAFLEHLVFLDGVVELVKPSDDFDIVPEILFRDIRDSSDDRALGEQVVRKQQLHIGLLLAKKHRQCVRESIALRKKNVSIKPFDVVLASKVFHDIHVDA